MSRIIKCGLIQAPNVAPTDAPIAEIKRANLDHQMKMVEDAAKQGVLMLCFQEIFTTPYFCADIILKTFRDVALTKGNRNTSLFRQGEFILKIVNIPAI